MKPETSSQRRRVIGVMGGARVSVEVENLAEELGRAIAGSGWVLLSGGRPAGVMQAASRGAAAAGGLVVGILPGRDPDDCAAGVTIAVATGLGDGRNLVNVLSADVVVALPGGAGTMSEVALAVKNRRPLVLLGNDPGPLVAAAEQAGRVRRAATVEQALEHIHELLGQ
ncbi:MAG: TIGR00725 family protein [Deltaproteobacteria bacterium]|nr:MAG: TIGR00725 family protein [Deltaproteobacteria bacterium]